MRGGGEEEMRGGGDQFAAGGRGYPLVHIKCSNIRSPPKKVLPIPLEYLTVDTPSKTVLVQSTY